MNCRSTWFATKNRHCPRLARKDRSKRPYFSAKRPKALLLFARYKTLLRNQYQKETVLELFSCKVPEVRPVSDENQLFSPDVLQGVSRFLRVSSGLANSI